METETRQIQLKCLEILNLVDAICRKHKIAYSLCGGSVVGAHLYGACLPWDDDVDLMMTREHYQRFLEVVQEELPERLVRLQERISDVRQVVFLVRPLGQGLEKRREGFMFTYIRHSSSR